MASTSHIKGTPKRTERPSKQEPEWNSSQPRQTTEPRRETFLSSSESPPSPPILPRSIFNFVSPSRVIPPPRSASSAISASLPSTNYELYHERQPESLAPNANQMAEIPPQNSEHSTAPWVLASRELHMPKKPMDFELITRLADLRYETDGTNSINSSSQASLALSGPSVPLRSSAYSQSISNFELDHGGQPESLAPNANQMSELPPQNSEHSTAPWVLASRELHMPKKPMDVELIARLADLRRQADGTSSISSSSEASLALLGSSVSLASSALSQSISVMSSSPAVEFPPTPVFADTIPAGFMRELEPLSTRQTPQAPALNNPYYPLQNSHTLTATWSLDSFDTTQSLDSVNTIQLLDSVDTTHEVDTSASTSSSPTLSSPNSTPRQQPMQLPTPTNSIPHYTLNVADHTPGQTQIPTQTPSSNVTQQPSSLTSASTATPRTIKPLPAQASTHPPPSMISPEHNPPSPPNKENLKAWWNQFTLVKSPKGNPFKDPYRVFGKPLKKSLQYASVQISTANANGELHVWGYLPLVIAKCGLYLKENATEIPGTFSISGSNRRMRDLQAAFESPPRYGKSLDWKKGSYTTHDVAGVFQRYLAQMPEPVIPYDMYHLFRDALAKEPFDQELLITTYKSLIRRMPRANQYLLLYILDLLSVFARQCDKNLMTATNLAVIFRPSVISHPEHEIKPKEHALSQRVLEFLIAQQDWFMLDVSPPTES